MPTYTYQCENCGIRFDRYQKFEEPALSYCPECNKKSLRKVYAPVGIVFKGSGFYATDHRSPSGATSPSTDKSKAVKPEASTGSTTTESTPKTADPSPAVKKSE